MVTTQTQNPANGPAHGTVLPFMFDNMPIRGKVVRIEHINDHVKSLLLGDKAIADLLAQMLVSATVMVYDLKEKANVTLQVHSQGKLPLLVAKCSHKGTVRAYAQKDHKEPKPMSADDVAKSTQDEGMFVISVDFGPGTTPYQSVVPIKGGNISSAMEDYFARSAQLDTHLKVFTETDKAGRTSCGAMFLQAMPPQGGDAALPAHKEKVSADDWRRMGIILSTLQPAEILPGKLSEKDVLVRLFAEDTVRVFPHQELTFRPDSTRQRMAEALVSLGEEEVRNIIEQEGGKLTIEDEFSGVAETFTLTDIDTIFKS